MTSAFERSRELLFDEALVLFASQGVDVRDAAFSDPPTQCVLASIGFAGEDMRGAIVLVSPPEAWAASAKTAMGDEEPTVAFLCDVAGEFCNLLSGHFRNRLLRLGVEVRCGIPTSAYGTLALPSLPANQALHIVQRSFDTPQGRITLRADFIFRDNFVFPEDSPHRVEPNTAAVILF